MINNWMKTYWKNGNWIKFKKYAFEFPGDYYELDRRNC